MNRKKIFFILAASMSSLCQASISFGSKDSSLVVQDGSTFQNSAVTTMQINGGRVANTGFGVIFGPSINFNRGVYTFFDSDSNLDGFLAPSTNVIQLGADFTRDGGTMIANPGGLTGVSINASAGSNIVRGQPLFFGPNDITLTDNSTILAIAVQNTLNTNITLNTGSIQLQDDLRLGDVASILDSGLVFLNDRRFATGGSASVWNGQIVWVGSGELELNSAVTLNGEWLFFDTMQINGFDNVIDISDGGSIVVLPGSTVRLAGVHIKGLGKNGGRILLASDATLILSGVIIEMDNNYHIDSGTMVIEGTSTIQTKEHLLTFKDSKTPGVFGNLIVENVALTYETFASIDNLNIRPALNQDPNSKHIQILGEGEIRTFSESPATFHAYSNAGKLVKYIIVAPYRLFQIFPTPLGNDMFDYNVVFDGNTNFMGFTRTDEQIFIISENVKATLKNVYLREVSTKHFKFEPNSKLTFGDKTAISFIRNEVLDYPWVFEGDTILKGAGQTLVLEGAGAIILKGKGSNLLLDGITIQGIKGNNIRVKDDSSKIQLRDVKWVQSGDFTYKHGALEILDDTIMYGPYNFNYQSPELLTVFTAATFSWVRNFIFNWDPSDGNSTQFQFTDPTAALLLDEATLGVQAPNLQLNTGRLVLRDRNFVSGNLNIGATVFLDQPAGATLEQI